MAKPSYLDPDVPTIYYDPDTGEVVSEISSVPAGTVAYFSLSSAPDGWLKANGAAISRTDYSNLFSAISTQFGAGNGSTTFNVPDLRGEFIRSLDDGRGITSNSLGSYQAASRVFYYNTTNLGYGNGVYDLDQTAAADLESGLETTYAAGGSFSNAVGSATCYVYGVRVRPRSKSLLACIKY